MKIVKPSYEILTPISKGGLEELKHLERIARVCYKSEDRITEDGSSAKDLIRRIITVEHEAMLEHGTLSVKFIVDRGVSHELVRHRLASFAQESTRYCNYSKEKFGNEITVIDLPFEKNVEYNMWLASMRASEDAYMFLLDRDVSPQIARSVLPNSLKTEVIMTTNYREWRHFFDLRCSLAAHPQIREVAIPLLDELTWRLPVLFDDIADKYLTKGKE